MKNNMAIFLFFYALTLYSTAICKNIESLEKKKEFRGLWIATTLNLNWPSKAGLSTEKQKKELLDLIKMAHSLKLNVLLFQVRPSSDALYHSCIEPWSEFLTGTMGKAPDPFYDPLEFAIKECHKRKIELHAWINPFRARMNYNGQTHCSKRHISKTHPEWVREYGNYQWVDPGEPSAQLYILAVIKDIVRRYNIDGIVMDDYFYPYKIRDKNNQSLDFPDAETKKRFGSAIKTAQWRRKNINTFVQNFYTTVKRIKPHIKVGISPFGIWKPDHPKGIKAGISAYDDLYADSKLWLQKGWIDYFIPQLYWELNPPEQSYKTLLTWWKKHNKKHRLLIAGNTLAKLDTHFNFQTNKEAQWSVDEIINQIKYTKTVAEASGNAFFGASMLQQNKDNIVEALKNIYTQTASLPTII